MAKGAWEVVIGLEVHAQLLTETKAFCSCSTTFGAEPNTQTCPICLALPGTLPVLNERVVEFGVRAGLGMGCEIRERSTFARKQYFYPDLPKGYQISQGDLPLCHDGALRIETKDGEKEIRIIRAHLEEDAGKNVHDPAGGPSRVDLNRSGMPLLEIVGAPDLRSSDDAVEYLKTLRTLLMYLGVNDGNLEEGSFRCDANVSVRKKGEEAFRTRVEVKNLNSFRFLKQAVDFEAKRQIEVWESGGEVEGETRLFDPGKGETRAMRTKDEAQDYRFFPEPDLPPLVVDDAFVRRVRESLPELPWAKARRFRDEHGLSAYDAGVLVSEKPLADYFEAAVSAYGKGAKPVANWVINEVLRLIKDSPEGIAATKATPERLSALLHLLDDGRVNAPSAKSILEEVHATGQAPEAVMAAKGLEQVSDTGAIDAAVDEVIAAHPDEFAAYRSGKKALFGFFMGQAMRALKGQGDPKAITATLRAKLDA